MSSIEQSSANRTLAQGRGDLRETLGSHDSSRPVWQEMGETIHRFGRYVLLDWLGSGGGGQVYAAYDPELDRKVAIKLMLGNAPGRPSNLRAQLLREAQALAKLSHPNVVAIYDVGTYEGVELDAHLPQPPEGEGGVYIVMEYVPGRNLAQWSDERPRHWKEVVAKFVEAGRGLVAAHQCGLVHRDFKPANVLVGDDGRVLVGDFGLAKVLEDSTRLSGSAFAANSLTFSSSASRSAVEQACSITGKVMGTPTYMSPEQHRGEMATVRSDVFSFAVALCHALYRKSPYTGEDVQAVYRAKIEENYAVPLGTDIPAWLAKAIRRGLRPDPADRFASMEEFLAVLERDRSVRTKRLAVLAASLAACGAVAAYMHVNSSNQLCAASDRDLAGIWDASVKARIKRAFLADAQPFAGDVWTSVERSLDGYTRQWQQLKREVCESTVEDKSQSLTAMQDQMLCLERKLKHVEALTKLFRDAGPAVVRKAVTAVGELPELSTCTEQRPAASVALEPSRHESLRLEDFLARASALRNLGRYVDAEEMAKQALAEAERIQDERVIARAWLELGTVYVAGGHFQAAERTYREGLYAAERSGNDEAATEALVALVSIVGRHLGRTEEALDLAALASARLARRGLEDARDVRLALNIGRVHDAAGRYDEEFAALEAAEQLAERVLAPDDPLRDDVYLTVGTAYARLGRYRRSVDYYRRTVDLAQRRGASPIALASGLANLAIASASLGEFSEARTHMQRALALIEPLLDTPHSTLAWILEGAGYVELEAGDPQRALERFERALVMLDALEGVPLEVERVNVLDNVARAHLRLGEVQRALRTTSDAIAQLDGVDEQGMVRTMVSLTRAEALAAAHREREAYAAFQSVVRRIAQSVHQRHPLRVRANRGLADAAYALGNVEEAVAIFEEALELSTGEDVSPAERAATQFSGARALFSTQPERARELAVEASRAYQREPAHQDERERVLAWLRSH